MTRLDREPSVSVVISTLNRAALLRKSLTSLIYQNYGNFEVVVVNGPSTDSTEQVLSIFTGNIIATQIGEANLSKSRNAGIAMSKGELVLFLDDDAFAEPDWIANIVSAYVDPSVGAVGTRVYDHTGFQWQVNPFLVDDCFSPNLLRKPPLWAFEFADAKSIPHILGASSSFRREALIKIGGFDEEIEYFLDESEACRRVVELGYKVRLLDTGACVHHKFASGVVRDERRILTHPYPVVKNKFYAVLSHCHQRGGRQSDYLKKCNAWVQELLDGALFQVNNQGISRTEYNKFVADVERGIKDGRERAAMGSRKSIVVPPAVPDGLTRFQRLSPSGGRKVMCLISRWTPRRSPGGVARYIWDLAMGFAERGHEVHLITATEGAAEVEYENGLWIHNLPEEEIPKRGISPSIVSALRDFRSNAARTNLAWARMAHDEVVRLRQDRYIDLVLAPAWDQEGVYCALDRALLTVVSMNTTFKKYAEIEWKHIDADTLRELMLLESLYIRSASAFHANSAASAKHLETAFGVAADRPIFTVPHGISDISRDTVARAKKRHAGQVAPVRILYVSRLERRKGTDLFLEACVELLKHGRDIEVLLVGRDSYADQPERSYRRQYEAGHPELIGRLKFCGEISDEELTRVSEESDIFCVPSRFESFGLIYIEAMRYGLPVVACDTGGVPDIVKDGETGILCKTQTAKELEIALARLVRDAAERQRMGEHGRARYLKHFEHNVVINNTLQEVVRLVDRYQSPQSKRGVVHATK
jgi:glycogen(starch) synthase